MLKLVAFGLLIMLPLPLLSQVSKADAKLVNVCELVKGNTYLRETARVTGEVDVRPEAIVLTSNGCDDAVHLQVPDTASESPELLDNLRKGIETKSSCQDRRPLQVVVEGMLDLASDPLGLFRTLNIKRVLEVAFVEGESRGCAKHDSLKSPKGPKLFPEPIRIRGTIVAYNWVAHTFPGFEGIVVDHFAVRVDKLESGNEDSRYLRVDFWGAPHLDEYRLSDTVYETGHKWNMFLVPPSAGAISGETCQPNVQKTIEGVDEESGKVVSSDPAFTVLEAAPDMPDFESLPCYVVKKNDLTLAE